MFVVLDGTPQPCMYNSVIENVYANNQLHSTKHMEPRRLYAALRHTFQKPFLDILDTTYGNMSTRAPYASSKKLETKKTCKPHTQFQNFQEVISIEYVRAPFCS